MSRKTSIILALVLLLVGIGVLSYPTLSDYVNRINGSYAIRELNDALAGAEPEIIAAQRRLALAYNAGLSAGSADTAAYDTIMDFGNGVMGRIQIPKIGVDLPIYHGTGSLVLSKGVGHMPGTAFPIGGPGNHAVLTGHTGLPTAELFTDLTELETGDRFYIHALEETLVYEVDQITVVLPEDADDLAAVPGQDYCTLVTCTPYGINSHRLLVRGSRIEMGEEAVSEALQAQVRQQVRFPPALLAAAAGAAAVLVCIVGLILKKEKRG